MVTYATEILDYIYESVDKLKAINEFIVAFKKLSQLMKLKEDKETKLDIMLDEDLFEIYTVGAVVVVIYNFLTLLTIDTNINQFIKVYHVNVNRKMYKILNLVMYNFVHFLIQFSSVISGFSLSFSL